MTSVEKELKDILKLAEAEIKRPIFTSTTLDAQTYLSRVILSLSYEIIEFVE
jgi:hypothetical protein